MDNKNEESEDELVTLVLGNNRVQANKKKLADYSLYFASLFSENFKDHVQNEFRINYDITLRTLNHFVNWVNNEGEHTRVIHSPKYFFFVRASLEIFLTGHYSELLELLELSVVFMAERLTEHIIEMIICMRLPPNNMLQIWLLAENLGLKVLRDVALATCLDRFDELSYSALTKLPVENFLKLILNVNVRSSPEKLQAVKEEWRSHNELPKDLPEAFSQFLNGDSEYVKTILGRKKKRYVQCVVGHKLNKSLSVWSWNGKTIQELAEMTDAQIHTTFEDNGKEITGRQLTGGGFNIYLVGGEQGIGSGCFNTALWRYCPFYKKWQIVTLLPRPRRHMAVAFIENKLYLFGGVGRHRCKLSSVDIFDVHTGVWSEGADIPEEFTEVPPSCVRNNKFVYHKSFYFIYDPIINRWPHNAPGPRLDPKFISEGCSLDYDYDYDYDNPIVSLVGTRNTDHSHYLIAYRSIIKRNMKRTYLVEDFIDWEKGRHSPHNIHVWVPENEPSVFDQQVVNWPYLISFAHSGGRAVVEVGQLIRANHNRTVDDQRPWRATYDRLKIYTKELKDAATDCFKQRLGCFNLIDPDSLHTIISLPEQASISV